MYPSSKTPLHCQGYRRGNITALGRMISHLPNWHRDGMSRTWLETIENGVLQVVETERKRDVGVPCLEEKLHLGSGTEVPPHSM